MPFITGQILQSSQNAIFSDRRKPLNLTQGFFHILPFGAPVSRATAVDNWKLLLASIGGDAALIYVHKRPNNRNFSAGKLGFGLKAIHPSIEAHI